MPVLGRSYRTCTPLAALTTPRETCPLTPANSATEAAWAQARNTSAAMMSHHPYCTRAAADDLSRAELLPSTQPAIARYYCVLPPCP